MNQKITLVQNVYNPSIFMVPTNYDHEGVSIKQVFMDNNFVDKKVYEKIGPRKISFGLNVSSSITVEATINE
mgnify:CR=1 FL=1